MSLIWQMVNRSLPMFCSESGPAWIIRAPYRTTKAQYPVTLPKRIIACHQDSSSELSSSRTGPHQGDRRLQNFGHGANHWLILSRSRDRFEGGPGSLLGSPGPDHVS